MKTEDLAPFKPFKLSSGQHDAPEEGMCAMEMVSWLAGEKWTDRPECACPVIAAAVRVANDNMPQAERDRLQTYLPRLIGSKDPGAEHARAQVFREWMWESLKALQSVADKYGFGSEWRNMTAEKTRSATESAERSAVSAARSAMRSAAWGVAGAAGAARSAAGAAGAEGAAAYAAAGAAMSAAWSVAGAPRDVWANFFPALEAALAAGKQGDPEYTEPHIDRARDLHRVLANAPQG